MNEVDRNSEMSSFYTSAKMTMKRYIKLATNLWMNGC